MSSVRKAKQQPQPDLKVVSDARSSSSLILDGLPDAIVMADSRGNILEANAAFLEACEISREDLSGKNLKAFQPQSNVSPQLRKFDWSRQSSSGLYEDTVVEWKKGTCLTTDLSVKEVHHSGQSYFVFWFKDITAKKKLEDEVVRRHAEVKKAYYELDKAHEELQSAQKQLVQAGKMAALGELSAGIAHEINQPLQGVRGYAEEVQHMLKPLLEGKAEAEEVFLYVKEILKNSDKIKEIVYYLRNFATGSTDKHRFVDVHHSLEESLRMLKKQFIEHRIQVDCHFDSDLKKVYANPIQLEQVFINLLTNARDAIRSTSRGSGTLTITTQMDEDFVEVYVQDDGCGMTEQTMNKMFNPFFSTKEVGQGMGLGMSLSFGILNQLSATISAESQLGEGSKFRVRIPRDFRELA